MSSLTGLSLQRCGRMPHAPDNTERLRAWDATKPVVFGNSIDWAYCKAARYAREQGPIDPIANYSDRRGF